MKQKQFQAVWSKRVEGQIQDYETLAKNDTSANHNLTSLNSQRSKTNLVYKTK